MTGAPIGMGSPVAELTSSTWAESELAKSELQKKNAANKVDRFMESSIVLVLIL
jgi:hypothetical protein